MLWYGTSAPLMSLTLQGYLPTAACTPALKLARVMMVAKSISVIVGLAVVKGEEEETTRGDLVRSIRSMARTASPP